MYAPVNDQVQRIGEKRGEVELADKPGSVVGSHSSGTMVAHRLKQPTRRLGEQPQRLPIWLCSEWGLPCRPCCHVRGELLPDLPCSRTESSCEVSRHFNLA